MGVRAPQVGEWYTDLDSQQLFEIVAFDDQSASIEIQYVDGEVGEFDMESWHRMNLGIAAAPEDWTSSYEINQEDAGFNDFSTEVVEDPLSTLEPESMLGFDEFY